MNKEAVQLIKRLGLKKHPEGGYFKQTYEAADTIVNVVGYDQTPIHFNSDLLHASW